MKILRKISGIFIQLSWNSKITEIKKRANFLDLNVRIRNYRFQTKIYNEQEKSDFNTIRML